jgi:DNA-binding CsgD family transcriptional regulator
VYRIVPLEAFENTRLPVLAVDAEGRVRYYNPATADLVGCEPGEALGRPCWRFARLRTCDGAPFCGRDCPVFKEARAGRSPDGRVVVFSRPARDPICFELLSFLVPPQRNGRWAVLHMLEPATAPAAVVGPGLGRAANDAPVTPAAAAAIPSPALVDRRLGLLTIREKEILNALADGLDAAEIADQFCLSDFTVRNHIQHILRKLHLHRQVDAILMLLEKHPVAHPQK